MENRLLNIVSEEVITLPLEDPKGESLAKRVNGIYNIYIEEQCETNKALLSPQGIHLLEQVASSTQRPQPQLLFKNLVQQF